MDFEEEKPIHLLEEDEIKLEEEEWMDEEKEEHQDHTYCKRIKTEEEYGHTSTVSPQNENTEIREVKDELLTDEYFEKNPVKLEEVLPDFSRHRMKKINKWNNTISELQKVKDETLTSEYFERNPVKLEEITDKQHTAQATIPPNTCIYCSKSKKDHLMQKFGKDGKMLILTRRFGIFTSEQIKKYKETNFSICRCHIPFICLFFDSLDPINFQILVERAKELWPGLTMKYFRSALDSFKKVNKYTAPHVPKSMSICTICFRSGTSNRFKSIYSRKTKLIVMVGSVLNGSKTVEKAKEMFPSTIKNHSICHHHLPQFHCNIRNQIHIFENGRNVLCSSKSPIMKIVNSFDAEMAVEEFSKII